MTLGKTIALAMGMAMLALLSEGALHAGEPSGWRMRDSVGQPAAVSATSLRGNASVNIGGEVRVDYQFVNARSRGDDGKTSTKIGDLSVKHANLRVVADAHPNIRAVFKLNLSADSEPSRDRDEIMEEAMLVMRSVGGTGLGVFAGKGRAPYGQDVTLGMLQSYHHSANHIDSAEGRVFIVTPPDEVNPNNPSVLPLGPMRPGQFDRTFMAGASYEWNERWKVEAAMFKPNRFEYRERLRDGENTRSGSEIGGAARVWWRPFEDLTFAFSAIAARSGDMARTYRRLDVPAGARGEKNAYAVSVGFDWRRGPWRAFGEYQHGWDWNFTKDYDTDSWQVGAAREFADAWRIGGMVEGLRIDNPSNRHTVDNYYKLAFNIRYAFTANLFVIAEYGHEWFRRDREGRLADKRRGDFFGMRLGFSF